MLLSIFIPTGNRAESLRKVLQSLSRQTYKHFEVIIVDYKSLDKTFSVITAYSKKLRLKLIHQKVKGLTRAANMALLAAHGKIFVRTDDDVIMSPGWLAAIHETFLLDKHIGGVTGPTIIPRAYLKNRDLFVFETKFKRGNWFWKLVGKLYFGFFMEHQPYAVSRWFKSGAFALGTNFESARKQPIQEASNLEACNFSVRTDALRQVGGFDEGYGGVGEYHEAAAAFKIKNLGYKLVFNPKAYLNHCPSQEGFYSDRPASYSRMVNFMFFYLTYIKPNSLSKFFRFSSYVLFLNIYYIVTALKTRQLAQLGALPGTAAGVIKYFTSK